VAIEAAQLIGGGLEEITALRAARLTRMRVAGGEEIEITRRGRPIARLVPAVGPHALKGSLTGVAITSAADEELFSTGETWELG
jgi:antitoxin (DNA-binding transcriptional repressor) of toxin-antitoxin stability system